VAVGEVGADRVCAVIASAEETSRAASVLEAVRGQTLRPRDQVVVPRRGGLAALRADSPWLWLLDGSVLPEPPALERLLQVLDDPGPLPAPVLLASKIVTPAGAFDRSSLPVAQVMDRDVAIAAFERRVVSLRLVRGGSLLVNREWVSVPGHPSLDPFADDLEWAARILWRGPGMLVPGSVAVRLPVDARAAHRRARRQLVERAKLLRTDAIDPTDKPWFALTVLEDGLEHLRSAPARRGRGT